METYTDIVAANAESATLDPIETEEIDTLNEGVFFFKNQAVLDKLSDNTNGELLYNKKVLAFKQEVDVVEYPSSDYFHANDLGSDVYEIVDDAETFNSGVKIVDIEFYYAEQWISVNGMHSLDSTPYFVNMDRTYSSVVTVFAEVYFPLGINTVFAELMNNGIPKMRVHYIPLTAEQGEKNG